MKVRSIPKTADTRTSARSKSARGKELGSKAAAKLLHISLSYISELADAGVFRPTRRSKGGRRMLLRAAVLSYKSESRTRQAKGLKVAMAATHRLGLYDEELVGLPVRCKRPP